MDFFKIITSNYILNVTVASWFSAQVIKFFINWLISDEFNFERLIGAGGMPSAHSAFVSSLAVATYQKCGFSSPEFAIALCFAIVVMYDAMGVRRAAGEQAKTLNIIINEMLQQVSAEKYNLQANLKEFLGHTPIQVFAGACLGISIALIF